MNFDVDEFVEKESWEGLLPPETNEEYHARKGYLSSSRLKERVSNAYNFKAMQNVPEEDRKSSSAFDLGSCVHEILLTKDRSQFVVMPDFKKITEKDYYKSGPRKGMEYDKVVKTIKSQVEEFEEANPGKRIISFDQNRRIEAMIGYIMSKDSVMNLFSHPDTLFEQGYLYLDPQTKERCMFRADAINPTTGDIIDLKTTQDASPYAFKKTIERYYYHLSAAHYLAGAERVYDKRFTFTFVGQESVYPYKVGTYRLTLGSLKKSLDMRRDLIRKIQKERFENIYPDFADLGLREVELAGYAFEIDEERV